MASERGACRSASAASTVQSSPPLNSSATRADTVSAASPADEPDGGGSDADGDGADGGGGMLCTRTRTASDSTCSSRSAGVAEDSALEGDASAFESDDRATSWRAAGSAVDLEIVHADRSTGATAADGADDGAAVAVAVAAAIAAIVRVTCDQK
jgi:hypothetical protein